MLRLPIVQRQAPRKKMRSCGRPLFIDLPSSPNGRPPPLREFTYCVAGNLAMQEAMQALTLKAHGVASVRMRYLTEPQQLAGCQLVLLGFGERADLQRWQAALANEPVLVVGESAEAFRNGAVIALVAEPNGLAFRINHTEAKRRGLVLSSQMLKLAREVK